MINIGRFIWFRHIAEKCNLDLPCRALYSYIATECLWLDSDSVRLTQEMMASALRTSKSTVNSSLKRLQECRLISGNRGQYKLMPPDEDWLERNYWSRIEEARSTPKGDFSHFEGNILVEQLIDDYQARHADDARDEEGY